MRHRLIVLVAATLLGGFGLPATPAEAGHAVRPCGTLTVKAIKYRVRAQGVTCAFARRWTNNFLRRGTRAAGYTCVRTGRRSPPFYCRRGTRSYFVIRT